ncbi:MAG: 30S ribosomal protein S6 [Desulfobacteraceae bacterium]|jgi:small subunit ribosomal protein S6|nr:MAG: 30S ribosomal protein S6 [Desulfobacteraceae bacterium]
MNFYETLYLVNPNLPEDEYKGLVAKYASAVEKNRGIIVDVAEWGKKSLAYQVKKFYTGFYVLLQYCGEAGTTAGLQHEMRLDDRVLKFQTVKIRSNVDPEQVKNEKKAPQKQRVQESLQTPAFAGDDQAAEETNNIVEDDNGDSDK